MSPVWALRQTAHCRVPGCRHSSPPWHPSWSDLCYPTAGSAGEPVQTTPPHVRVLLTAPCVYTYSIVLIPVICNFYHSETVTSLKCSFFHVIQVTFFIHVWYENIVHRQCIIYRLMARCCDGARGEGHLLYSLDSCNMWLLSLRNYVASLWCSFLVLVTCQSANAHHITWHLVSVHPSVVGPSVCLSALAWMAQIGVTDL